MSSGKRSRSSIPSTSESTVAQKVAKKPGRGIQQAPGPTDTYTNPRNLLLFYKVWILNFCQVYCHYHDQMDF